MLFTIILFVACNSTDDRATIVENSFKIYEGNWNGTYSGTSQGGTWSATIDDKGKATGVLVSGSVSFDLKG